MANSSIKILRSGESGKSPESLEHGELALNYNDGKLFYLNSSNNISFIKNSDSFSTINVSNQLVMANSSADILNLVGLNGIDVSANNKTITFELQTSNLINSNSAIAASANSVSIVNGNLISHSVDYLYHNKIIEISSSGEVLMDSYSKAEYRTAEYNIQAKNSSNVHVGKVVISHNDTDLFFIEPWEMLSTANTRLYTFNSVFNGNAVEVYLTASNANTNFKITRTIIPA